jgi:hypothetical protein
LASEVAHRVSIRLAGLSAYGRRTYATGSLPGLRCVAHEFAGSGGESQDGASGATSLDEVFGLAEDGFERGQRGFTAPVHAVLSMELDERGNVRRFGPKVEVEERASAFGGQGVEVLVEREEAVEEGEVGLVELQRCCGHIP